MSTGPVPPASLPPRNFSENYHNYQLAGHDPATPWWATPLAYVLFFAVLVVVLGLFLWL